MQTMMVEVNSSSALKVLRSLNEKKQIKILDETSSESPSLPGKPMSLTAFKTWIDHAESSHSISFQEVKKIWAGKRKQLQNLTQ